MQTKYSASQQHEAESRKQKAEIAVGQWGAEKQKLGKQKVEIDP
jgi:hypothetical protein